MIIFASDPTKNGFNDFLKNNGVFIALGVAALIAIAIIVVLAIHFYSNKNNSVVEESIVKPDVSIYEYLGGKENVLHHEKNGSRISLELKDDSKLDADKLKGIGVDSIIKMSNKTTLVVRNNPDEFYKLFN